MIYDYLFDWQKEIVDRYKYKQNFGLFLDMGLGKTPISLAFAEKNNCEKILIISINTKVIENENVNGSFFNWIQKSDIKYNLKDKYSTNFDANLPEVFIINYESLYERGKRTLKEQFKLKQNVIDFIKSCKNKNVAMIIDESHKIKDLQSLQTKSIFKIKNNLLYYSKNLYMYLLSGTPFTTGYIDLYSQLKLLGCQMLKGEFKEKFCVMGNRPGLLGWQQPIVGYKNTDKLYDLVHKYSITMKSPIKLPESIFVNHISNLSYDFKMFIKKQVNGKRLLEYMKIRKNKISKEDFEKYNVDKLVNNPYYANIDYPKDDYLANTAGSFWLRARELSIGFQGNSNNSIWIDKNRLNDLKDFLKNNENNYILFYQYTPELLEIYSICEELGYNIDIYSGDIKSEYYYEKYSNQSNDEKITNNKNILLANWSSGSTGKNWQEYHNMILFDVPLYKDYEQGIKRINRIGQTNTCIYHFFFQNNWLDKSMIESLKEGITYSEFLFFDKLKEENDETKNNERLEN